MRAKTWKAMAATAGAIGLAASAMASSGTDQSTNPPGWQERFDSLESEMRELREQNTIQQQEIARLRSEVEGDWITEARATEIRTLLHDVLVDADTRSSLLANAQTAGWSSEDGFFIADPGGKFRLNVGGQIQARFVAAFRDTGDEWRWGFENTRTKLIFRGHVFNPGLTYYVKGNFGRRGGGLQFGGDTDLGGEFRLQDAWARWALNNNWSVRAGQFKLPFNREELVGSQYQLAVERSLVNEVMNIGRSQGLELMYKTNSMRWNLAISDGGNDQLLGPNEQGTGGGFAIGTTPANTPALSEGVDWAVSSRLEYLVAGRWEQFRDFTSPAEDDYGVLIGIAGHSQENEHGTPGASEVWWTWTADASLEFGGANLFFSLTHHNADTKTPIAGVLDYYGVVAQGGFYILPKTELYGRFEYATVDSSVASFGTPKDLYLGTVGVNYYLDGHDAKFTVDGGVAFSEVQGMSSPVFWARPITGFRGDVTDADPQVVFRTQFQMLF